MISFRPLLALCLISAGAPVAAHTMLQMAAYDITREIEITSTSVTLHYDARVTSDTQLPLVQPFLDSDSDGLVTDRDVVTMSRLCVENLGLDIAVYLNNNIVETTTVSEQLEGGGRVGFKVSMRSVLPPRPAEITTETITIIDPAYMFPPIDQTRTWKDSKVRSGDVTRLVGEDNRPVTERTMESTPTNVILVVRP